MSADTYTYLTKHPKGGFVILVGFASDDEYPVVHENRAYEVFDTIEAAILDYSREVNQEFATGKYWTEYGLSVDPGIAVDPPKPGVLGKPSVDDGCMLSHAGTCMRRDHWHLQA